MAFSQEYYRWRGISWNGSLHLIENKSDRMIKIRPKTLTGGFIELGAAGDWSAIPAPGPS
jgi:hypothetical protein